MTSDAQLALVTGVVSAASALAGLVGGTFLGWFLSGRTEKRAEKRAAFVELLSAMDECQHAALAMHVAVTNGDSVELLKQKEVMTSVLRRVDNARSVATITVDSGDESTINAAIQACFDEYSRAIKPEPFNTAIYESWKSVIALARKEIG